MADLLTIAVLLWMACYAYRNFIKGENKYRGKFK